MVFSGYIIKIPYWIAWKVYRIFKRENELSFYLGTIHDYYLIKDILPHLNYPYQIIAKNKSISKNLQEKGIKNTVWPAFPTTVIMPRHAFHKFPIKAIKKIGMRHGPYHFKKMIDVSKYNAFDLFLFTSKHEAQQAEKQGIHCGVSGGYPRLDFLQSSENKRHSEELISENWYRKDKATLLFTSTWKHSGMSAVDKWINHIENLAADYNILVSLHPQMPTAYYQKVSAMRNIRLVNAHELPAAMQAADMMISDISSVIAEFCALNKPVITFTVEDNKRLTTEIAGMIDEISLQIDHISQLESAILTCEKNPELKASERNKWNMRFFDDISESQSQKAASIINEFMANR